MLSRFMDIKVAMQQADIATPVFELEPAIESFFEAAMEDF